MANHHSGFENIHCTNAAESDDIRERTSVECWQSMQALKVTPKGCPHLPQVSLEMRSAALHHINEFADKQIQSARHSRDNRVFWQTAKNMARAAFVDNRFRSYLDNAPPLIVSPYSPATPSYNPAGNASALGICNGDSTARARANLPYGGFHSYIKR